MSQRDKLLQEFSQTEEERWAQLMGGGVGGGDGGDEQGAANENSEVVVERLHSVKEKRAPRERDRAATTSGTKEKASQPQPPAAAATTAKGPKQLTLFDKRLQSQQSNSQIADLDKLITKFKDEEEDVDKIDISKFMQRDDDEDDDDDERRGDDDENFSADSFLAQLLVSGGGGKSDTAVSSSSSQQRNHPTSSSLLDVAEEGEEGRVVVPLSDDAFMGAPQNTTVPKKESKKSQAAAAHSTKVALNTTSSNFVKKEVNTGPLEIKQETSVKREAGLDEETAVGAPSAVAGGGAVVPASAAVYWLDAKEQDHMYAVDPGSIFLFGKYVVPDEAGNVNSRKGSNKVYESCCVRVSGIQRCVMLLPKEGTPCEAAIPEVAAVCSRLRIRNFRMKIVERLYAFEEPNIPRAKRQWIKLRFPATEPPLPASSIQWQSIEAVVGANRSLLELFLLKRRLRGPSYLSITEWQPVPVGQRVSLCKHEFRVLDPKHLAPVDGGTPPPLVAVSLQLCSQLDSSNSHNEVHAVSMIVSTSISADGSGRPATVSNQLIGVRPFNGQAPLPHDMEKLCASKGLPNVRRFANEQQLLQWTSTMLNDIDPDVLIGHNFFAFTLDLLLHRFRLLNVHRWSSLGRLDLRQFPKLQTGVGGTGDSSQIEREVCVGRLVVDTYLLAREYHRSSNYKLIALAQQLKLRGIFGVVDETFNDVPPTIDPHTMTVSASIFDVVARCVNNAVLSLALANQLDVIPLTKRLCALAGNLWSRTLSGSRAERIEFLLLHAFHQLKFITPDKKSYEAIQRAKRAADGIDDDAPNEDNNGGAAAAAGAAGGSRRAKAKYKGGMVLEPKSGLYTDYILLLDFNSLYPSLIQEFNICFTTVRRPGGCTVYEEGENPNVPSEVPPPEALVCPECAKVAAAAPCVHRCILPKVIKSLVDSRREVKRLMKSERDPNNLAQLEVRQKALKLTANSMYGCLGFEYSRFYAQPLAELVTRQGRAALLKTVDIVPSVNPSLRVLYGDTDSVMIQTGVRDDLRMVRDFATAIKARVNKDYRCLEIDIDGVFRSILLHKKKKYAAITVVDWATEGKILKKEVKGLDMVRRDWCPLSQRCCDEILDRILFPTATSSSSNESSSGNGGDDVLDFIAGYMKKVADEVRAGNVFLLEDFTIAKSLTKEPETYKGTSFPHATVALRMRERKEQVRVGDLIPYVICYDENPSCSLAARAFHPEEVKRDNRRLDVEWYLATQIYPPVLRICEHIQGFTATQLCEAMGIQVSHAADQGGAGGRVDENSREDRSKDMEMFTNLFRSQRLDECFPEVTPLEVACCKCQRMMVVQPHNDVQRQLDLLIGDAELPATPFRLYVCECGTAQSPVYIANCLANSVRRLMQRFYANGGSGDAVRILRQQMTYFRALFDTPHMPGCSRKLLRLHTDYALCCLDSNGTLITRAQASRLPKFEAVDPVLETLQLLYDRVDHMFVRLSTIFSSDDDPTTYIALPPVTRGARVEA